MAQCDIGWINLNIRLFKNVSMTQIS